MNPIFHFKPSIGRRFQKQNTKAKQEQPFGKPFSYRGCESAWLNTPQVIWLITGAGKATLCIAGR